MNVLVLGGTKFLGRHVVFAASAAGHQVTVLHRGLTQCPLPDGTEELLGDRMGAARMLGDRRWDLVVDTSGQGPEGVEASAGHLAGRAAHYVFVSTVSVYGDTTQVGMDEESAPLHALAPDGTRPATPETYGALKALSEQVVRRHFGDRCSVVRPGLIVGRWDPSGRYTYWADRFLRGGEVLAPGAPDRLVQLVDAQDLAQWFLTLGDRGNGRTFNAVGPARPLTMEDLLASLSAAAASLGAPPSSLTWVDDAALKDAGVGAWVEMPLWLPQDPQLDGFLRMDARRARASGLTFRSQRDTASDVMLWLKEDPAQANLTAGLASERERAIISAVGGSGR
jgi:2'-hydroxyisoflavone reductase